MVVVSPPIPVPTKLPSHSVHFPVPRKFHFLSKKKIINKELNWGETGELGNWGIGRLRRDWGMGGIPPP